MSSQAVTFDAAATEKKDTTFLLKESKNRKMIFTFCSAAICIERGKIKQPEIINIDIM